MVPHYRCTVFQTTTPGNLTGSQSYWIAASQAAGIGDYKEGTVENVDNESQQKNHEKDNE